MELPTNTSTVAKPFGLRNMTWSGCSFSRYIQSWGTVIRYGYSGLAYVSHWIVVGSGIGISVVGVAGVVASEAEWVELGWYTEVDSFEQAVPKEKTPKRDKRGIASHQKCNHRCMGTVPMSRFLQIWAYFRVHPRQPKGWEGILRHARATMSPALPRTKSVLGATFPHAGGGEPMTTGSGYSRLDLSPRGWG